MPQPSASFFSSRDDLDSHDHVLIQLYLKHNVPVDALAYTPAFDSLYEDAKRSGDPRSQAEVFRRLLTLRKSARLPILDWKRSA